MHMIHGGGEVRAETVEAVFHYMDVNRDGRVSFEEFLECIRAPPPPPGRSRRT